MSRLHTAAMTFRNYVNRICSKVQLPADGRHQLMKHLVEHHKPLIGISDASLKDGQGAHSWILTTGDLDHLNDPLINIFGRGPVDGHPTDMSSAQGELQGQTALAIMLTNLLKAHQNKKMNVIFHGEHRGPKKMCKAYNGKIVRSSTT